MTRPKPQNKWRSCPHCPQCDIRMFYNNKEHSEYRCGQCGKRFRFEVVEYVVGYPKFKLKETK